MTGFIQPPRGGISWQLAGERLALLAWGRALLLQLAHPSIAAAVSAHSGFRDGPIAPFVRLHHTVGAMRRIAFGAPDEADAAVAGIRRIHDRVHGVTGAGAPYSAHYPDLLLWVHATLLDSHVRVLAPVLGPFAADALDTYCRDTAPLALALGARPADVPHDWPALQAYVDERLASGAIVVGADARALAPYILRPPGRWLAWPLARAAARISVGTLPPAIRLAYGEPWDAHDDVALARTLARVRALRQRLPDVVARWPEARRA